MKVKITAIGMVVLAIGSAIAEPVDWVSLQALSPMAFEEAKGVEIERGRKFENMEEMRTVLVSEDFQNRISKRVSDFCKTHTKNHETSDSIICKNQPSQN